MGLNTLNNRAAGQTILDTFFNDIHQAMNQDFVGRNGSGVPTAGQNLGTVAIPWGTGRFTGLIVNGQSIDPSLVSSPVNVVKSGKTRTTSNQPQFLTPHGAALSAIIDGTPTNLVLDINGSAVSVITDITKSGLTAAPSSNNTALVNEATAADQFDTKFWGMENHKSHDYITVDNMGSEITALVGKWAAFSIAGVSTEYFLAFVESSTKLSRIFRGCFYNSSLAPVKNTAFTDNDVITLLKLTWVFVENDATTVDVTYTNPVWSFTSPSSPATGDYWYDMSNGVWKRYDGASFVIINRTLVGILASDTTACIAARCEDFYANYQEKNTLEIMKFSTEIARGSNPDAVVSVAGMDFAFKKGFANWNITTDLASAADMFDASEQASRAYYLYLKDTGEEVISDWKPYWRHDLYGSYHPHNPWRMVGIVYNDSSSDLVSAWATAAWNKPIQLRYNRNSAQAIANTTDVTILATTKNYDSHNLYDTGTGKVFIPAPGVYDAGGMIVFDANAGGSARELKLMVNGSWVAGLGHGQNNNNPDAQIGTTPWYFEAGDEVEWAAFQDSGGSINIGAGNGGIENYIHLKSSGPFER